MTRVLDDHDFTIEIPRTHGPHSCRLQVFTAPGTRPVIVATQDDLAPVGKSVTNAAEAFAQEAWRRHLPGQREAPRWIEHYVSGYWLEVTFDVDADGRLSSPSWAGTSHEAVNALVGQVVEADRGERFVPPEPEPARPAAFYLLPVTALPKTVPFRTDGCMPAPRRPYVEASCCDYHAGDWRTVMDVIGHVVEGREQLELSPEDRVAYRDAVLAATPDGTWLQAAAESLWSDPICLNGAGWVNGQHRAQAAIDAGARRLLVECCDGFRPQLRRSWRQRLRDAVASWTVRI